MRFIWGVGGIWGIFQRYVQFILDCTCKAWNALVHSENRLSVGWWIFGPKSTRFQQARVDEGEEVHRPLTISSIIDQRGQREMMRKTCFGGYCCLHLFTHTTNFHEPKSTAGVLTTWEGILAQ